MTVPSWVVNVWCSRPLSAALLPGVETGEVEAGEVETAEVETAEEVTAEAGGGDVDALSSAHAAAINSTPTHIITRAGAERECLIADSLPHT
ncbi:MAG TPA: hypothetical protein VFE86_19385 [Ilumatobacteraceae bacterium]|nr:hypothetical protein [Ilumatobacteraceae bacterium]